jgi:microcystin degradation protein MlrC
VSKKKLRVAIGGLSHETTTFTPVATSVSDFTWWFARGNQMTEVFRGTNSPIGGFLAGAADEGFEIVPIQHAEALPSGPVSREGFETLLTQLCNGLAHALPVDGLLLDIHGAMVAEGRDDCDGEILREVRRLVGPTTPIVAQLDIHANASPAMAEHADLLVGRRTYPELDMAARGRDCAVLLARLCREEIQTNATLCQLPLIWGTRQATEQEPMATMMRRLNQVITERETLTASILTGFRWADSPHTGSSVYVATSSNVEHSRAITRDLVDLIVAQADDWYEDLRSTREAIEAGEQRGRYPVVLADYLDNPGNGSPGDSTGMLRAFLEAGLTDAAVLYIVDPESVARCVTAGPGARVRLQLGGKSHPAQGPPIDTDAEVLSLSDGRFRYTTLYAGLESSLGPSALTLVEGVHVVIVSERQQPFDPDFALSLGLDCRQLRWIGVKSMQHFRAGFEPFAGAVELVEEPNVHGPALEYRRLGRSLYPIDPAALEGWRTNPDASITTHVRDRSGIRP